MRAFLLIGMAAILLEAAPARGQDKPAGASHRELVVAQRYLHLPVRTGAKMRRMKLLTDGKVFREFDIELVSGKPEFWAFVDLGGFRGKTVQVELDGNQAGAAGLDALIQSDEVPDAGAMYHERLRPQFHFTSRRGWHNDPNGLVWQAGTYHLFYQHNPYGWNWGNMHWGHATSPDLVHWTELPTALYPPRHGDWCFSGSAVVDSKNTSGFQQGSEPPLVAAFTSTGRGECIVYSNDRGLTWSEYAGNPVVKHQGRDPRLLWFEEKRNWIMAVYDENGGTQGISFYSSPDLKQWTFQSKIDGFYECPDLFQLPIEGQSGKGVWILYAADGKYVLGEFDGHAFRPTSGKEKLQVWHGNFYAAQSFSDTPDGRRIQIGWGREITFPGMPFNQQMTVPVELTLRTTVDGQRLFARPVRELESLRAGKHSWENLVVNTDRQPLQGPQGDLYEIEAVFEASGDRSLELDLRGTPLVFDGARQELTCKNVRAPLSPVDGLIRLQIFVDRGSIEVFGNEGRVAMSVAAIPEQDNRSIVLSGRNGAVNVRKLVVHELRSSWNVP